MRIAALALVSTVLVGACCSRTDLFEPESRTGLFEPESRTSCQYDNPKEILALANDTSMSALQYVEECHLTPSQASSIVRGRPYRDVSELEISGPDASFCSDFIACSKPHQKPPCTPSTHPDVVLELVVDESGSMTGEKWEALRDALLALFSDIANDRDTAMRVGLVMFDDQATTRVSPRSLVSAGQLDALERAVDKPKPHGGGTSTRRALDAAYSVLNSEAVPRRAIVLLSDGSPTGGEDEKDECIELVSSESSSNGTRLFSVGIGSFPSTSTSAYDPSFMGNLAKAGGTAPPGCESTSDDESRICHFQVTPGLDPGVLRDSFGRALDEIRETATTCP